MELRTHSMQFLIDQFKLKENVYCCRVDHNTYSMQFLIDQFKLKEKQRKERKRKGFPGDSDSAIASEEDSEEELDKVVTMGIDSDSEEDITELF